MPFSWLRAVALALATSAGLWSHAQPVAAPPVSLTDWREANDAVGRFERGHADLLRWEAQHAPSTPATEAPSAEAWTLSGAIVSAQRTRPDLVARPGLNARERAELQGAHRALALEVERAWWRAIAARHHRVVQGQIVQAAATGHELATRMARIGNWPEARQHQETLIWLEAQSQLHVAAHEERAAVLALWRLTGSDDTPEVLAGRLPTTWPEPPLPDNALSDVRLLETQALQQHPTWPLLALEAQRATAGTGSMDGLREAIQLATAPMAESGAPQPLPALSAPARWPHGVDKALEAQAAAAALERRIRADVRIAHSAWLTARLLAQETSRDTQRLMQALEDDMQQRYNGMFKSTWELLAATRARRQADQTAHQAQLNAALALADLRAVLDGLPYSGTGPSAGSAAANPDKGH